MNPLHVSRGFFCMVLMLFSGFFSLELFHSLCLLLFSSCIFIGVLDKIWVCFLFCYLKVAPVLGMKGVGEGGVLKVTPKTLSVWGIEFASCCVWVLLTVLIDSLKLCSAAVSWTSHSWVWLVWDQNIFKVVLLEWIPAALNPLTGLLMLAVSL